MRSKEGNGCFHLPYVGRVPKHATMCNLHSNMMSHEAMRRLFDVSQDKSALGNFAPLPAIYPKNDAPIVLIDDNGDRSLATSSWGFLTPKKSKKTGNWIKPSAWNNTRDDKVRSAPLWKASFEERRCLVPATAYAEATGRNPATYHWFRVKDAEGFAFAGIWKNFKGMVGDTEVDGLFHSILTTTPNELAATVHNRMPVMLSGEMFDQWLCGTPDEAARLIVPSPGDDLEIFAAGEGLRREPTED